MKTQPNYIYYAKSADRCMTESGEAISEVAVLVQKSVTQVRHGTVSDGRLAIVGA